MTAVCGWQQQATCLQMTNQHLNPLGTARAMGLASASYTQTTPASSPTTRKSSKKALRRLYCVLLGINKNDKSNQGVGMTDSNRASPQGWMAYRATPSSLQFAARLVLLLLQVRLTAVEAEGRATCAREVLRKRESKRRREEALETARMLE